MFQKPTFKNSSTLQINAIKGSPKAVARHGKTAPAQDTPSPQSSPQLLQSAVSSAYWVPVIALFPAQR